MKLDLISRYRTEVMGIAILWIVLYHSNINFGATHYFFLFDAIESIGYSGADLFFFLSGFGLVYGWFHHRYKISDFYKKKILRILPIYWCALLLYLIPNLIFIKDFKVRGFIADLFGLGFLTSKSYNFWFVPSIVICYLSFPAIIHLLNKGVVRKNINSFWSILFSATLFPSILCMIAILTNKYQLLIFFARLPSFIVGILIGYLHFENKVKNSKDLGLNFLTSFLIFIIGGGVLLFVNASINIGIAWRYGLLWYPFIFITFPLCLLLAYLVDWFNKYFSDFVFFSIIKKCLVFCGNYSLEIYLAHVLLFQFANNLRATVYTQVLPERFSIQ